MSTNLQTYNGQYILRAFWITAHAVAVNHEGECDTRLLHFLSVYDKETCLKRQCICLDWFKEGQILPESGFLIAA